MFVLSIKKVKFLIMNTWQVNINNEGNLMIQGTNADSGSIDLFGSHKYEYLLCVENHNLRRLKNYLDDLFPKVKILNKETFISVIKEQFFTNRDLSAFRSLLNSMNIPFRYHSHVA